MRTFAPTSESPPTFLTRTALPGRPDAKRRPGSSTPAPPAHTAGTRTRRSGHDYTRIPAHAVVPGAPQAIRPTSTRNPNDTADGEIVTQGPAPAPGVFPPVPSPPAAPSCQCHVASGPAYTPTGSIPVTNSGGRKRATFTMAATFGTAYVTLPPRKPSCCEVRQYIKWDDAFHTWKGGPPHGGFPAAASANTWYEDRDTSDKRYGHRSGPHSDPIGGCGDEYLKDGARDQANGDTYCGRDSPGGPSAITGKFEFQLKVIDTANGNAVKASSSVISVNW